MKITLRKLRIDQSMIQGIRGYAVISCYAVELDGIPAGEVGQDDIEPYEAGAARHLWHAWMYPLPWEDADADGEEAVGARCLTRFEAVDELLFELAFELDRKGLAEGERIRAALRADRG